MKAESLLPGTHALLCLTVEWTTYHGKQLVRYRDRQGYTRRESFTDPDAAFVFYSDCVNKLREEVRNRAHEAR